MNGYARIPETGAAARRRRWAVTGLAVAALCGLAALRAAPIVEAADAAGDAESLESDGGDDWPSVTMATPRLDGIAVNVVLSAPTRTSIVVSSWCAEGSRVEILYWNSESGRGAGVSTAEAACGGAALGLTIDGLEPATAYAYVARIDGGSETAEHGFATAKAAGDGVVFTLSADAHLYASAARRSIFAEMAAKALSLNPNFHVQLGCSWMLDNYYDYEQTEGDVYAFVRGARALGLGDLAADVALYNVQGPHEGENWVDYRACRYASGLSTDAIERRAQWSVLARLAAFPPPRANAYYSGSNATDSYAPCGVGDEVAAGNRRSYYSFENGGVLVVALDAWWYYDERALNGTNWMFSLGATQYAWLEKTLAHSTASRKIVTTHNLVGGYPKAIDFTNQRGGARAARSFEWGGRSQDGTLEFERYRPGWSAPIHDVLARHGVDAVVHGHDHVTAVEFVDGILYLELPWMSEGGASAAEREAYLGTDKAYYNEVAPTFASFAATAAGDFGLEIRDVSSNATVYRHDFPSR